jgi:hypothetical protein
MKKIDLIVSALEDYEANLEIRLKLFDQALAAARELKSLKPVAWMTPNETCTDCFVWERTEDHTIPLYRLDEVTK